MAGRLCAACALVALLLAPPARTNAQEQDFDAAEPTRCALQKALAALTCKSPDEFNFIGEHEGVYVYNTYYAVHDAEFYVQIEDGGLVIFSSPDWGTERMSARMAVDAARGCVAVHVQEQPCNNITRASCCAAPPARGGPAGPAGGEHAANAR